MNRIYLKKYKDNCYQIRDLLDDKKLGEIVFENDLYNYKLKKKYKSNFVATEALILLKPDIGITFTDTYKHFINQYTKDIYDTKEYCFNIFPESIRLKSCGQDMFGRNTLLHPAAKKAWVKMKTSAKSDKVDLQIVSAYRSLDYQQQLIQNKLDEDLLIEDILTVNVLPGYSEHHTGCAIDIGSEGEAILTEEFEQSNAFRWLLKNAGEFGFVMSYPKNNTTGICYEPWHWCYKNVKCDKPKTSSTLT